MGLASLLRSMAVSTAVIQLSQLCIECNELSYEKYKDFHITPYCGH
jgi:hypothetical protein